MNLAAGLSTMSDNRHQVEKLTINVDGASRGNPGPASVGVVIRNSDGEEIKTLSEYIGAATNNVAEYFSLIYALQEAAILKASKVVVYTDSQLMARQFSGQYKVKEPHVRMLHRLVSHLSKHFSDCSVIHIPREENKEADRLASDAVETYL